jgi:hypothetical protein
VALSKNIFFRVVSEIEASPSSLNAKNIKKQYQKPHYIAKTSGPQQQKRTAKTPETRIARISLKNYEGVPTDPKATV